MTMLQRSSTTIVSTAALREVLLKARMGGWGFRVWGLGFRVQGLGFRDV